MRVEVQHTNGECGVIAVIEQAGKNVHDALDEAGCRCCPEDHHHGENARITGVPCRPVTVSGFVPVNLAE